MADERRSTEGEGTRLSNILSDFTIFHKEATGRIVGNGGESEADFVLYQLCNGNVIIEANARGFTKLTMRSTAWSPMSVRGKAFELKGHTETGLLFKAENAIIIAGPQSNGTTTKLGFALDPSKHLALRRSDATCSRSKSFVFALANVLESRYFRVPLEQKYNVLFRRDVQDEQLLTVMKHMRLPAFTGWLTVESASGGEISIDYAEDLVNDITHLLSLAEGHLVSALHAKALDIQGNLAQMHIWDARTGRPVPQFALIDGKYTAMFLRCTWPTLRSMPDKQQFKVILEYYLCAKELGIVQDDLLNGCLVLEMVANLSECLRQLSYSKKVERILAQYKVEFDDLFRSAAELRELRGDIMHNGRVKEERRLSAYQASRNLLALLDRLFLAMLQYDGELRDWSREGRMRTMTEVTRK